MKKSVVLQIVISIAIIALVLYLSDFEKVLSKLSTLNFFYLFISMLFYTASNLFMAYRIKLVLKELKKEVKISETLPANMSGMLASDITPARTGYFATAFVLNSDERIPLDKAMVSILGPQIFEFSLKIITGAIAFWYLINYVVSSGNNFELKIAGMLMGVFVLFSMVMFIVLLLFSKSFLGKISFLKILPYGKDIYSMLLKMQKSSKAIRNLTAKITLLIFITWAIKACEWLFVAKSLNMNLNIHVYDVVFFAFLQPLVTILQFVPTPTLAGMGLSEGGATVILSLFGVPYYEGVAFALLTRAMNMLVDLTGIQGVLKVLRKHLYRLD
jgi:uncharacterized protein (TIRG00374 family)